MSYHVHSEQLTNVKRFFDAAPEIARESAMMAMNQVLQRQDVESQIAFPQGYLDSPDRLEVSRKATRNNLEAVITARDRPTSLARFAPGQTPESTRGKPLTVQVKKGRAKGLKKAFLVRLKNGNIGLAVRLKQGETIRNKNEVKAVMLDKGVYLLYGPSVDQVMKTVAAESLLPIADLIENEFHRQFARLARG